MGCQLALYSPEPPLAGGRERGAPLGAEPSAVTSAFGRAPSGAVRGQDPPVAGLFADIQLKLCVLSPADGKAIFAWIGPAHQHTRLRIDQDPLKSAEDADGPDDPVAACVEAVPRFRRDG
jgi:hypothetical protein